MFLFDRLITKIAHAENMVKNAVTFICMLFITVYTLGTFDFLKVLLAFLGFVLAYHSVYFFNDLMDYEIDKKNAFKRSIKPLLNGQITKKDALSNTFFYSIIGLALSFSVSFIFGAIVAALLFMNFLHSSNKIRLKETPLRFPNLFIMQCLKVSVAWFAVSNSLEGFPIFLVTLVGFYYLISYSYYKQIDRTPVKEFLKQRKIIFLVALTVASYFLSVILYPFRLLLIIPLIFGGFSMIIIVIKRCYLRPMIKLLMVDLLYIIIFLSILMSVFPIAPVAQANEYLEKSFEPVKKNITETEKTLTFYIQDKISAFAPGQEIFTRIF